MKPIECTSDFIYFIEQDVIYSNRVSFEPVTDPPVDGQDLAGMRVNGWRRVMLCLGQNIPRASRRDRNVYDEDTWYIVAEPTRNGDFKMPLGDPEFEYEALISF
jgi:hypothetical protein